MAYPLEFHLCDRLQSHCEILRCRNELKAFMRLNIVGPLVASSEEEDPNLVRIDTDLDHAGVVHDFWGPHVELHVGNSWDHQFILRDSHLILLLDINNLRDLARLIAELKIIAVAIEDLSVKVGF